MPPVALLVLGLLALVGGAELLVRGGSRLAARLGISPIVVGLTVVSLGTSMPELAVGVDAALKGSGGLAVGNIVGTNIVNLLLILGVSAMLRPIALDVRTIRLDLPAMTVAALLLVLMSLDGELTGFEGALLLVAGVAYTIVTVRSGRREAAAVQAEYAEEYGAGTEARPEGRALREVVWLVTGIAVIVLGADFLVDGAVSVARSMGVSDAVIGLTVVAIGTSAPELVTTVVSTIRGDRDIAIGNLLGSSVYNIVFILGATLLISPTTIEVPPEVVYGDLLLMGAVAIACVPVFRSGRRITRVEGGVFVAAYLVYLAYLLTVRT